MLRQAPLNKLLVETDAPIWLPAFRGQRASRQGNCCYRVPERVLEMPLEQVADNIRNACACFGVHDAA